jgi:hypothetical protein
MNVEVCGKNEEEEHELHVPTVNLDRQACGVENGRTF